MINVTSFVGRFCSMMVACPHLFTMSPLSAFERQYKNLWRIDIYEDVFS